MLPNLTLLGLLLAPIALAHPSLEGWFESERLFKRAGTTAELGDYTGDTSSYADGSGTYVDSKDQGTYASGVKCWTDIVSLNLIMKLWVNQAALTSHSSMSPINTKPSPGRP